MLTALILRHAKAVAGDADLQDFDRPLAARGQLDAQRMGTVMASRLLRPNLVLVSPAQRTRETWLHVAPSFADPPSATAIEVQFLDVIYLAEMRQLLLLLKSAPSTCATLLMIGHNPDLQDLAVGLCGSAGDKQQRRMMGLKFPTCGLAVLQFDAPTWAKVKLGSGHLTAFITPRSLDDTA
jgi:phosphohistidine phosphatase